MILEFGKAFGGTELIRVTADYSNAVLVAVLPYVADVAQKLNLPLTHPVAIEHVSHCSILPQRKIGVEIGISNEWFFAFQDGHVRTVQGPRSFQLLQEPEKIPDYFGEVKVANADAVQMAREALVKLGISLDSVFADQEPQINPPRRYGTNIAPFYYITWPDPRGGSSVEIEVNANLRRIERLSIRNKSLERPSPTLTVNHPSSQNNIQGPRINPDYAAQLIPLVLQAIDAYSEKLSLPIQIPLRTNLVARFSLQENNEGPYVELETTNGWRFIYEHDMVTGYYCPDNLFHSDGQPISLKKYFGQWNTTEREAIKLVSQSLSNLGYTTNLTHIDSPPRVTKPAIAGIPRYMFRWEYSEEGDSIMRSAVAAEVDADKGQLKSLYFGNVAFWGRKPPINIPLRLPGTNDINSGPTFRLPGKASMRPFVPLDAKQK